MWFLVCPFSTTPPPLPPSPDSCRYPEQTAVRGMWSADYAGLRHGIRAAADCHSQHPPTRPQIAAPWRLTTMGVVAPLPHGAFCAAVEWGTQAQILFGPRRSSVRLLATITATRNVRPPAKSTPASPSVLPCIAAGYAAVSAIGLEWGTGGLCQPGNSLARQAPPPNALIKSGCRSFGALVPLARFTVLSDERCAAASELPAPIG